MGIKELLPLLKPAMKTVSLSEYRGRKIAVDGNVWLHRGAFSCAFELHMGQVLCVCACGRACVWITSQRRATALTRLHGCAPRTLAQPTDAYVQYCHKMAQLLIDHGARVLVVFDGQSLGAKADTAAKRLEGRKQAVSRLNNELDAMREFELQAEAQPSNGELALEVGAARARVERLAQQTVKVTSAMVERTMASLRARGIDVLRAPYEADAQLAYLAAHRMCDAVLTEDSDLVAYACPCVLYKLDRYAATVQRVSGRPSRHRGIATLPPARVAQPP